MRNKQKTRRIIFLFLTAAFTIFIFANSLTVGEQSAKQSNFIVDIVLSAFNLVGIKADADLLFVLIRKLAHFSEYFVLGLLAFFALYNPSKRKITFFAPIYCLLVAVADEFIMQRITEGRSPQLTDVLIDFSGVVFGLLTVACILYLKTKKSNK